jgi:hypothetical protein
MNNQVISRVNLVGQKDAIVGLWITTNHRGWFELTGYGFTSLTLEGLSSMVGKKLGRQLSITADM